MKEREFRASIFGSDNGTIVISRKKEFAVKRCSDCGNVVPKKLSTRIHRCPHCGLIIDRDVNAALNILKSYPNSGQELPVEPVGHAPWGDG